MFEKVTIKDIAELVGVSKATISYYLNGNYNKMSAATREKIRKAIEITGYQPSVIAKGLATQDTKTIGVVIADITNPFISSVMKGVHDACREFGYTVNFTNSDNDLQIELENLSRLNQQNVSGIILDSVAADNPIIRSLNNHNTVMVDRQSKKLVVDSVVSDNEQSTFNFIKEMKRKGYEDIYFVSFPIDGISTRELRYKGFKRAMKINEDDNLIILNQKNLAEKIGNLIKNRKKKLAFFTVNGPALLTFMKLLNNLPYNYPDDYGIGTYEDLDWMDVLNPNISCVRQDSYEIGRTAASYLIQKLKEMPTDISPKVIEVPNKIVMRNSL